LRGRRTLPAFLCDWTVALLDAAVVVRRRDRGR
jgi:hypothetical protein